MRKPRKFVSCAAPQIEAFVRHRRAAGTICDGAVARLRQLDTHIAAEFPDGEALSQEMVDTWCARRPTESANTCGARCRPVVALVSFLRERGETDVVEPDLPRAQKSGYVPHAFTDDELSEFFSECDSWEPKGRGMKKKVYLRTKRTIPVIFRLLWSSGIRTCEARLLARRCVDLDDGVIRIERGKGNNQRLVALHESLLPMMREYDAAMELLWPDREYFFPNGAKESISGTLLCTWFRDLWSRVSDERATAYMLRHDFCVRCINRIASRGTEALADLEWVSKAMGHSSVDVTVRCYYHITPALSALMQERSAARLDETIPEA